MRLSGLETVYRDVIKIQAFRKANAELPQNFFEQCLQKKSRNFESFVQWASLHLKSSYAFSLVSAKMRLHQGRYEEAIQLYKAAAERDPKDVDSLLKAFELWQGGELARLGAKEPKATQEEILSFMKKNEDFIDAISKNRNAGPAVILKVLVNKAAAIKGLQLEAEALQAWRAVLQIDPNHPDALYSLARYEIEKKNWQGARKLLENLARLAPQNKAVQKDLLTLVLRDKDFTNALTQAKELNLRFPADPLLQAMLATSYLGLGRHSEAAVINEKAIAGDPKNFLALKNAAELNEYEGDRWASQKLYGKAIARYMAALEFSPDRNELRMKTAQVLYDFRKGEGFREDAATKADLQEVVKLLHSLVERSMADEQTLTTYISAAARSAQIPRARKMCTYFEKNYGKMTDAELKQSCSLASRSLSSN